MGSGSPSRWDDGPAIAGGSPDTGWGYTVPGMKDSAGRLPVFSRQGANAFAAMVRDSGGQVKASDIASSQRSRGKNAAVGGVEGSEHLGGNAMDIHGSSIAWIRKNGARYGWVVNDYPGSHGGHVEFRGGGGNGGLPIGRIVSLARSAGFTGENAAIMAAIAMAESGGEPGAHNLSRSTGDNSYGLWQINMIDTMGPARIKQFGIRRNEDLFEPGANAKAARKVHGDQGFGAWSVYRSGAYLQYLPAARRALGGR